ncbi:hypothetical protein [Streptomyces sp. NPDC056600]|uniref:hypothetical protein n=1 Tax=Streptomyces sp. NPDC056600 TaxID=3345874 RepID=UPI0036C90388
MSAPSLTGTAQAWPAASGTLSFSGEAGEPVSGGQAYALSADTVDMFDVQGYTGGDGVSITVNTPEGERWTLTMAAPDGRRLADGDTFANALRWPYAEPTDPQLEFSETDRWCGTSTGSFTVDHISFGPYGYVRELDASFEQYCGDSTVPLRGEVHAVMPAPPVELTLGMTLDSTGTVDAKTGQATVGGAISCDKPARVTVMGAVHQYQKHATDAAIGGSIENVVVNCVPGGPVPWSATVTPRDTGQVFRPGTLTVRATAKAPDQDYPVTVSTGEQAADLTLTKA